MICNECQEMFALSEFSEGNCIICGDSITTGHMPYYQACIKCSEKKNYCQQCGKSMNE